MAESYPSLAGGQRVTAALLRSMLPMVARKTADTSRAATTTLTADPHLTFELEAGAVYVMDGWIKFDGPSAADIIFDWTTPVGALGEWTGWAAGHSPVISFSIGAAVQTDTVSARGYTIRTEPRDIAAASSFGTLGVSAYLTLTIMGTIRVGSVSGTYSLDWAQQTSDASATTVYTDSWLRLQRIA
jgi:hypothetical protein